MQSFILQMCYGLISGKKIYMKQLSVIKKENVDLEKPVNKLNKSLLLNSIKFILGLLVLITGSNAIAQENALANGRYILGDIQVTGKISYNEQTVVTFTGLEKGQLINVPGEEISTAIKKLWRLGLFDDVNFYVNRIEGDSIFLELNLNELPKLSKG
jgi:outer membrane protein insertion porin family